MADDREILREIWDGRLPICFKLSVDEVYTMQQPDPYYLMVPRLSYFPLVTDKVQKHFTRHLQEQYQNAEMWLEYNGQALKWHYPIGVLFDLFASDAQLPWHITVHFKSFPEEELLHCRGRAAVESHFMSTVKEADAMKHRSQIINGMQKKDHGQLWQGLQNDKFDQFWSVNRKLMEKGSEDKFKYIPFRIYEVDRTWTQKLVRPVLDNGEVATLEHLLRLSLPHFYSNGPNEKLKIVTHGIQPPLETPLQWLSEHLSYPDNFLHLCVIHAS